jgi:phage-related protein
MDRIAKSTKKQLLDMAKGLGIKNVSGLKVDEIRRVLLKAILAPKQAVEEATEKIADNAKKTVASTQTKAPPVDPTVVTKASDTGTNSVQASQVEKDAVAVKEQAKADGTATKKDVTAPVDPKPVKEKSSRGTKKVQQAQAEADAKAVDAQVKADSNTVKKIPIPFGKPLEGVAPKAQKFASTVEQTFMNAQISVTKPIDDIINALNLVGQGSRKVPFIFTKEKFIQLSQILGIQLPPIFNKMGELVDANGQALGVTRESLVKLIQSMTRTAKAPDILANIAGQTILEFEGEVNRALALGKGAKKRFNFKGVAGKLQDALSRAFTTASGDIFSDAAGKVASATGAQKGDIDYTKIGYRDLDKKANLRNARKTVLMRDEDGNIKRVKVGTRDARATLESLIPQVGDSLQIGMKEFRQYVLTAKRIVDELMAGFEPGRAKRAVYRREMSSTEGYERTLKSGKSLDLMTEAQYEAFNKKRQKGIQAARDKIAERYEQELQAKRGSETPALIGQEDQASYRESIRAADEAARNAGGRNKTLPKIISEKTQQFIFDIDTQIAKAVGSRLAELTKEFGSIQAIPKNALESAKGAAIDRASRDLTQARNEQVSLIEFNTKSLKGKLDKLASRESELQAQIEKAKTFKGAALKTDEAKALFGSTRGKTDAERRDNYIKEKQILIDNLSIEGKTLKVIKEEIAANEKLLQLIDKRVSKLREEILLRRGGLPRFGTSKPSGFTPPTVEEFTEKPKSKTSGSVGYLPKPSIGVNESGQRVDAVSKAQDIIVTKAAEIPKNVLKAQEAVSKLQRELTTLESISKSLRNMSMKRGTFADDKEIRKFFNLTKSATTKELEELSTQIANKILEITTALEKAQAKLAKMAPDISPSMRPKSLSAAVPDGPTLLGNINTQLQSAMQIPTNVLDQFLQSLKVQGKGLAEIAQGVGLGAVDDLELLKQELANIGMTIEKAIATPAEALKQLQAVNFAKAGPVQEMFQRLVMYARDVATLGVQEAFDKTVERLNKSRAKSAASKDTTPAGEAKPKKLPKVERIGSFPIAVAELEKDGDLAYQQMQQLNDYIKKFGITFQELNSLGGRQLQYLADAVLGGTDREKPVPGAARKLTAKRDDAIAIISNAIGEKLVADAAVVASTPPAKSRLRGTVVPSGEPTPAPATITPPVPPVAPAPPPTVVAPTPPPVAPPVSATRSLQDRIDAQLAKSTQKRLDMMQARLKSEYLQSRLDYQLQRSAAKRLSMWQPSMASIQNQLSQQPIIPSIPKPTVAQLVAQMGQQIDFKQVGRMFIDDLSYIPKDLRAVGRIYKNLFRNIGAEVMAEVRKNRAPSAMKGLVRTILNPLTLVEKGLGSFSNTFGKTFSPSRIEYLARALGGTAPLMKYRKTDPLTGEAMPPIEGFVNNLKAVVPRALMGVGSAIQKTNLFPNLKALLQTTYAPYLPTPLSGSLGRGGKLKTDQAAPTRTGMGGILDRNLARAGIAPSRVSTGRAEELSARLFANIGPSGFETMTNSVVKSILNLTNKLYSGTGRINSALETAGKVLFYSFGRVTGRLIQGSAILLTVVPDLGMNLAIAFKNLGKNLLGNIGGALKIIDTLAMTSGSQGAVKFAGKLRASATRGAAIASLQRDTSAIDLANLTVKQKLGALAGIITTAGVQFGMSSTKVALQVTGAMTMLALKFVPFGSSINKLASGIARLPGTLKAAGEQAGRFAGAMNILKAKMMGGTYMGVNNQEVKSDGIRGMIFGVKPDANGQGGRKGLVGGAMAGIQGFGAGLKSSVMGGMGTAVSMLSYQFGMVGMIAGPVLTNIIQKIAMIPKVGGPVILLLAALVGAFFLLKKSTSAWAQYSDGAIAKFKLAWEKIQDIFGLILAPIIDFFASFLGGADKSGKSAEDLGKKIGNFADKILLVLPKIQDFVEKNIVPVIRQIMSGIKPIVEAFVPAIKFIINIIKAVVSLFKGDFSNAWGRIKDAFGNLRDVVGKVLKGIIIILAPILKLIVTLFFAMVTTIVNILEQIPIFFVNSIRWMAKAATQLFFSGIVQPVIFIVDFILTAFSKLLQGLVNIAKMIAKTYINTWFGIAKGLLGLASKIPFVGGAFDKLKGYVKGAQNKVVDFVDNGADSVNKLIGRLAGVGNALGDMAQTAQNKLMSGIDSVANWLTGKIGSASNFAAAGRKAINSFIDGMVKGGLIPKGLGKQLGKDVGQTLKDDPSAAKAAGQAIANAVKEGMKSLQDSYFDAVIGNIGNAMSKIKTELSEILNKQKEDALKAYDDQIAGIEALAEAEERLTATEEYESNRRQRIKDRELQRNNYQKERTLAIYEGRVDDARNLDLAELKNADDFNNEISDLDKSRQRELQGQNRQDAIAIIQKNKDDAAKLFDEAIKEFEDYVEEVTRNGTISETQLSEQFGRIAAKANEKSAAINTAFQTSFSQLPALIRTGLDPTTSDAGFFSTEMGKLVEVAKTRFGLSSGTGGNAESILGVTSTMLTSTSAGIPSVISTAFGSGGVIQTTYGTALTALSKYISDKQDPTNPESLSAVYKKAITDANATMEQEALKAQRGIGSAFAAIVATINEKVKALTIAEAVKKGLEEAKKAAAEGAKDIGNAIGGGGGSSGGGQRYSYWFRRKGTGVSGWRGAPAQSMDRYIGDNRYDTTSTLLGTRPNFFKGGKMPYGNGGPTFGPMNQGIPATLHGGEFVIRKAAVDKYGLDMLNQLNKGIYVPKVPKFNMPMSNYAKISGVSNAPQMTSSETTHNYNFYVDNFIGETEWFNSMMKEYNMKVVPANQKQAGLESRVIKTYNGINRGM